VKRHFEKKAEIIRIARLFGLVLIGFSLEYTISQVNARAATEVKPEAARFVPESQNPASQNLKADPKKVPNELDGVGVNEHLGQTIDLAHLQFIDASDGKSHALQEYFRPGKPVLLNLVYFECPMLCTMVLNGVKDGMKDLTWSIGKEYDVITVSINPSDTPAMGLAKRDNYIKSYLEKGHDAVAVNQGWHFFTGTENQIKLLASQLGFDYKYDSVQKQYAHAAVTFILTPTGEISRYLYGITYKAKDLRLALLEASQGKVGNVFDRFLMFCYHYEPSSRGYALQAVRVMQAAGVATIAIFGGFLTLFWTRQRKGRTK
jgi:protein SCO1/2